LHLEGFDLFVKVGISVLYDFAKDFFLIKLKCEKIKTIKTMLMKKVRDGVLKALIA
jgi:hypothetical protein